GSGLSLSTSTRTSGSFCTTGTFGLNSGISALLVPHPDEAFDRAPRGGLARQRAERESVAEPDLPRSFGAGDGCRRDGPVGAIIEPAGTCDHLARTQAASVDPGAPDGRRLRQIGIKPEQQIGRAHV